MNALLHETIDSDDVYVSTDQADVSKHGQTVEEINRALLMAEAFKANGKFYTFEPYDKQKEFYDLGAKCNERMLRAGNQEGKTYAAAYETTCHMTGIYPKWWAGHRFDKLHARMDRWRHGPARARCPTVAPPGRSRKGRRSLWQRLYTEGAYRR